MGKPLPDKDALTKRRDELDAQLKKLGDTIKHAEFFQDKTPRAFAMSGPAMPLLTTGIYAVIRHPVDLAYSLAWMAAPVAIHSPGHVAPTDEQARRGEGGGGPAVASVARHHLRRKLGSERIRTLRGVGYMIRG